MWRVVRRRLLESFPGLRACQQALYRFKPYSLKFRVYYKERAWGGDSASGPGSSLRRTRNIRQQLPALIGQLQINSILDVPCGDFHWMRHVNLDGISYCGVDIVREQRFQTGDGRCTSLFAPVTS